MKHILNRQYFEDLLNRQKHSKDEWKEHKIYHEVYYPDRFGTALRRLNGNAFEERFRRWVNAH